VSRGQREFLRFAVVGSGGFAIDAAAFLTLLAAGIDPFVARAASCLVAMTATWWANRQWTFRLDGQPVLRGTYPAYLAVQSGGLSINYGVFAVVHVLIADGPVHPLFALAAGSAAALVFNFAGARALVFRSPS
jgi:putative flippase GtrA